MMPLLHHLGIGEDCGAGFQRRRGAELTKSSEMRKLRRHLGHAAGMNNALARSHARAAGSRDMSVSARISSKDLA